MPVIIKDKVVADVSWTAQRHEAFKRHAWGRVQRSQDQACDRKGVF